MPKYLIVAKTFWYTGGGVGGVGAVVASSDALYILDRDTSSDVMGTPVALATKLALEASPIASEARSHLESFGTLSLPDPVTTHPDWPSHIRYDTAIVVPRSDVSRIQDSVGTYFTIDLSDGRQYRLELSHRSTSIDFLNGNGWTPDETVGFLRQLTPFAIAPVTGAIGYGATMGTDLQGLGAAFGVIGGLVAGLIYVTRRQPLS